MSPKISVVTVVYNRAASIGDALASLSAQTHKNVEHIVVDGGSTDGTLETLRAQQPPIDTLISEPDEGIYDALNKGVSRATGDVIGILHSDDLFTDSLVLRDVAAAFGDPSVEAVYGDLVYVQKNDTSRVVRHWRSGEPSPAALRRGWMPPHPSLFLRRSVYDRFGVFDTQYRIAADYDFMLRVFLPGIEYRYIPRVLVTMRVGGESNATIKRLIRKSAEDWRIMKRAKINPTRALLGKVLQKAPQFFWAKLKRTRPTE